MQKSSKIACIRRDCKIIVKIDPTRKTMSMSHYLSLNLCKPVPYCSIDWLPYSLAVNSNMKIPLKTTAIIRKTSDTTLPWLKILIITLKKSKRLYYEKLHSGGYPIQDLNDPHMFLGISVGPLWFSSRSYFITSMPNI